jgi:hypothetical protein
MRSAKEYREELEAIDKIMENHGLGFYYNRRDALDKALSRSYPTELDTIQKQLQVAIDEIDKLKIGPKEKRGAVWVRLST